MTVPARIQVVERARVASCAQPTATDRPTDLSILFINDAGDIYETDIIDRQDPDDLVRFKEYRQWFVTEIDAGNMKMSPLFYNEMGYELEILL